MWCACACRFGTHVGVGRVHGVGVVLHVAHVQSV